MMEYVPQVKHDELYPLLKVEAATEDNILKPQVPSTTAYSGWHVACIPKQSWCKRWPELVSACWMTAILLAISVFVFYAIGMSTYRRHPVVIVRCNDTKGVSDVYYHYIASRDAYVPFSLFSEYLSYMAKQYPFLHFNVYFLIDDSWQNPVQHSRHLTLLKRLIPQIAGPFNTVFDQSFYKREIKDFQRRYQNVNISVMYLSNYMATTPLKYKWRTIPQKYLSFYARIYAIWQNGGIGFDLVSFNNQFHNNQAVDHRIDAILKQHNDGIDSERYGDALNSFHNEENSELFSTFFDLINQILNDTRSFFTADLSSDVKVIENNSVIRTHRSKRDINNNTINDTEASENIIIEKETTNDTSKESKNITDNINFHNMNISKEINDTNQRNHRESLKCHEVFDILKTPNISLINTDMPPPLFFYKIFAFSDDIGPPYFLPKSLAASDPGLIKSPAVKYASKHGQGKFKYLSMTPEGHFVAASSRHHPFLAQMFSAGCQRVSPVYAIKDTLLSQCSEFLRNDIYCENIRILYNVI